MPHSNVRKFTFAGLIAVPVLAVVAVAIAFAWGQSSTEPANAAATPAMELVVKSGGVCAGNKCNVPVSGTFTLGVDVVKAPAAGYSFFQTFINYGATGLGYKKQALAVENVGEPTFPDALAIRINPGALTVSHVGGNTLLPPFVGQFYTGNLVEIHLNCPAAPASAHVVSLEELDANGDPGTIFIEPDGVTFYLASDTIEINCIVVPTSTFTNTPTHTNTPTFANTPTHTNTPPPTFTPTNTKTPTPTFTPGGPSAMELTVKAGSKPCTPPVTNKVCVTAGSTFTLGVDVIKPPFPGGYSFFQTFIDYGATGLVYKKQTRAAENVGDVSFPDANALRTNPGAMNVTHAGANSLTPPFVPQFYVGNLVEIHLNCPTAPSSSHVVSLDALDGAGNPATFFGDPDGVTTFPASDTIMINCVVQPSATPTPPPTNTNTPTPTFTNTPTSTFTPIPPPPFVKSPSLQNLWLTRQGAKIPPVQCIGPQGGDDSADLSVDLGGPVATLDPKGSGEVVNVGAFEFEVNYDQKKICVELVPGPAAANMTCFIEDAATKPTLEGVARIGCVTLGKDTPTPDTTTEAGRLLAYVRVRPQPDVYSQVKPNQQNGNVVQLLNKKCELADLQGHAIPTASCDDADVTIRYLEGDVEPDCSVDTLDTQAIAFRWGSDKGSLVYNDRFNLEPFGTQADNDIDIKDLQFVYGRFGSTCEAPHPDQPPVNAKE